MQCDDILIPQTIDLVQKVGSSLFIGEIMQRGLGVCEIDADFETR